MKKCLLLIFIGFVFQPVFSQEYLKDIDYNLEQNLKSQDKVYLKNAFGKIYYLIDTLSLPFMDDFSVNRFTYYHLPNFTQNAIRDTLLYNFLVDGQDRDSLLYMADTSWNYVFNNATLEVDSFPKPSMELALFRNDPFPASPFVPYAVIEVWPEFYRYSFDDSGNKLDSVYVQPVLTIRKDTIVTKLVDISEKKSLWFDFDVYLNNSFPVNPPTIGVATFDGLRWDGRAYSPGQLNAHGVADHLTSKPIDLNYLASDSIYFSFYYQPQGIGNQPEAIDSLVLEFYSPIDTAWTWIWGLGGMALKPFEHVLIPVTDTRFLNSGFRFRFKNYASLSGNLDHWHVDYVRLDRNRHINDTMPMDVAFTYPANILLKNYTEIPWKHFVANPSKEMHDTLRVFLRNNSGNGEIVNYSYAIRDALGTDLRLHNSSGPVDAGTNASFTNRIANNFVFPSSPGKYNEFEIYNQVFIQNDINRNNDTLRHIQKFDNFYAYDDGVPEAGYGLLKQGAKIAYRFDLNVRDTLTSVSMHFTPVNQNVQFYPFRLTIWRSLNPEVVLYESAELQYPSYDAGLNGFADYPLDAPLITDGTIFIGWVQTTNAELNIGFDKNNSRKDRMFYNLDQAWVNTQFNGSWMIRPVFGNSSDPAVGFDEPEPMIEEEKIKVFPNPARERLFISGLEKNPFAIVKMYDIYGRLVYERNADSSSQIGLNEFSAGIYIIRVEHPEKGIIHQDKIILSK
jgi:hypothetical protein